MPTLNAPLTATYVTTVPQEYVTVYCTGATDVMLVTWVGPGGITGQTTVRTTTAAGQEIGPFPDNTTVQFSALSGSPVYFGYVDSLGPKISGASTFLRWCIPGRDTSGTLFKDVSGNGYDGTIEAGNTTPYAVDARMSTIAATNGGISLSLAAGAMNWLTDSAIMSFTMTNADPGASVTLASWGAGGSGFSSPGFYFSHRSSSAGVGRAVLNNGSGTLVSGTDSTVKFSNAGGTRETCAMLAYDAQTGSLYLYRDGVLAASNVGLATGANALTTGTATRAPRLGATGDSTTTVAGVFRGWQGYSFPNRGLPLNIGRVAAKLAESPSVGLQDFEFRFA